MFKKPNRQISIRQHSTCKDENSEPNVVKKDTENKSEVVPAANSTKVSAAIKPINNAAKKSITDKVSLSFLDAEEEDDGEIFHVRKSSHSRRIARQLQAERSRRQQKQQQHSGAADTEHVPSTQSHVQHTASVTGQQKQQQQRKDQKSSKASAVNQLNKTQCSANERVGSVLAGHEAEYADYRSSDEEEEEPSDLGAGEGARDNSRNSAPLSHKFNKHDSIKRVLQEGIIPNAEMIHAVRKRREAARRMAGSCQLPEYVPLRSTDGGCTDVSSCNSAQKKSNDGQFGGAEMDDDEEFSDTDEQRVEFLSSTAHKDRQMRINKFQSARDQDYEDEMKEGSKEVSAWENEQLRKAMSGSQASTGKLLLNSVSAHHTAPTVADDTTGAQQLYSAVSSPRPVHLLPAPLARRKRRSAPELSAQLVKQRLLTRRQALVSEFDEKIKQRDQLVDTMVSCQMTIERLTTESSEVVKRHEFYEQQRFFFTDLVECYNIKLAAIEALESRMFDEVWSRRSRFLADRRSTDTSDEHVFVQSLAGGAVAGAPLHTEQTSQEVAERKRRAAERQGRRMRRAIAREAASVTSHVAGWSSDEELNVGDEDKFSASAKQITEQAAFVMQDVHEEFCALRLILERFRQWRAYDHKTYCDAYVSLSLTQLVQPLVRVALISWNPLAENSEYRIEASDWFIALCAYSRDQTTPLCVSQPDNHLVSRVVSRVICPRLQRFVTDVWDPLSSRQSRALCGHIQRLAHTYPTVDSANLHFVRLVEAVYERLELATRKSLFIPSYPAVNSQQKSASITFFSRRLAAAIKLMSCIGQVWAGVISDEHLQYLTLGRVLNQHVLIALSQVSRVCDCVRFCQLICSSIPTAWCRSSDFNGDVGQCLPCLQMFANYMDIFISQNINSSTFIREHLGVVVSLLEHIGAAKYVCKWSSQMHQS